MATKNLHLVKKSIYDKLSKDSTLITLLGGTYIYLERNPDKPIYPSIVYGIVAELDNIYNEDINEDGNITETTFNVTIFSDSPTSEPSDNIESRVKVLLNGARKLSSDSVSCFGCFKQYSDQRYDVDAKIWITTSIYKLVTAPK
jgi:hypothetical protein